MFRYFSASLMAKAQKGATPKDDYRGLFQATLNEQFYNATNWYTIEEETFTASGIFQEVDVHINHLINTETGLKLGDDWKTLSFMNLEHPIEMGKLYKYNDSYWLTTNKEGVANLTGTCTIRRCNNTLRWVEWKTGEIFEEPCCIEYLVKEPRNYMTQGSPFITPGGFLHIEAQLNKNTDNIRENQRFLFGNKNHWTCYRVIGTGVNDFRNEKTFDNDSAKVLTLDLIADFVSYELDDVERGIANIYRNLYELNLNFESTSGKIGDSITLVPTILYNGVTSPREVLWSSDNENVATVDGTGNVTCIANGEARITAQIKGNPASAICNITVSNSPEETADIRIEPYINYILESTTREYRVYLYIDNVKQENTAIQFTCGSNDIPASHYVFTVTGDNSFKLSNRKMAPGKLLNITCEVNGYSKVFQITLRGAW